MLKISTEYPISGPMLARIKKTINLPDNGTLQCFQDPYIENVYALRIISDDEDLAGDMVYFHKPTEKFDDCEESEFSSFPPESIY